MNLTGLERVGGDGACESALLVDKDSYLGENNSYVPISLLWTISESDYKNISCCVHSFRVEVDLGNNGTSVDSLKCIYDEFEKFEGNPYLKDGCQYKEECAKCRDSGGYCDYESKNNFTCEFISFSYYDHASKSPQGVILGVSISSDA
ncbi:hypothetical protein L1987_37272 [Smallanthus sonchifolius]|uniref:Uncharacterized protein n=1 Tax=Smallanthus sonchifolius TaxID=185202 RepID=A0ACB9HFQ9_9ASTR|nr:hypothetical protein L1987_37272 [Smallanthus sonchifolius]